MRLRFDKIFLTVFKILLYYEVFFGDLSFAIIAQMYCGNQRNILSSDFINVFSRRATGYHRRAKLLEMTFFIRKTFP